MATLKQRLHRKNSSGTYDTIHLETSADCITGTLPVSHGGTGNTTGLAASATKLATARTIRTNLASTSTASFNGTANITPGITGTLPVSHGGTGRSTLTSGYFLRGNGTGAVTMSSIDQVKSALGVDDSSQSGVIMKILFETGALYNPSGETVADLNSSVSVGSVVVFDGKLWRVVHKSGSVVYLASQYWIRNTQFDSGGSTAYKGSDLANVAMAYQNNTMSSDALAQCNNVTVNSVTAKVFVCSYEQANGGFSYFNNNTNRILYNTGGNVQSWWTSSAYSLVWYVNADGTLNNYNSDPTHTFGFRPFVALQL